jgi:DENN (AEX-3) domain
VFLEAAYRSGLPGPGHIYHVEYGQSRVFTCPTPNPMNLPSVPENRNLTEYINAVDTHNMLLIFASMLYERRILVTSKKLSRLSACVQVIGLWKYNFFLLSSVLWIRNFSLRIRIRLFNEFRIRILLVKSSGFGTDLFPDEI